MKYPMSAAIPTPPAIIVVGLAPYCSLKAREYSSDCVRFE